jgi:hypothetical protein
MYVSILARTLLVSTLLGSCMAKSAAQETQLSTSFGVVSPSCAATGTTYKLGAKAPVLTDEYGRTCASGTIATTPSNTSNTAMGQVAVGTATNPATLLVAARPGRVSVVIVNETNVVIRVGASSNLSSIANTTKLLGLDGASITIESSAAIYGYGLSAATISYVEVY